MTTEPISSQEHIELEEGEITEEDIYISSQVAPMESPPSSSCHGGFPINSSSASSPRYEFLPCSTSWKRKLGSIIPVGDGEVGDCIQEDCLGGKQKAKAVSTELTLFDKSWQSGKNMNSKGFFGWKQDKESIITAQNIKKFSIYTRKEEEIERISQISTKLKLYEDPWKIKRTLRKCDCTILDRLMVKKVAVERHVIPNMKVSKEELEDGMEFDVWDYDTKTEHVLKLEKWSSCYIFGTHWKSKFVKRRELKSGDEIALFWNTIENRFWFRVLARASSPKPATNTGG